MSWGFPLVLTSKKTDPTSRPATWTEEPNEPANALSVPWKDECAIDRTMDPRFAKRA